MQTDLVFWCARTLDVLRMLEGAEFAGLPTCFPRVDKNIPGLVRGAVTLVGGAPGMGKTAFVSNIVWRNIMYETIDSQKQRILMVSAEMGSVLWIQRLVSMALDVPQGVLALKSEARVYWDKTRKQMRPLDTNYDLFHNIEQALDEIKTWPVEVLGEGLVSTNTIKQELGRLTQEVGVDVPLVIVDHAGALADVGETDASTSRPDLLSAEFDNIAQTFNTHCLVIWPLTKVGTTTDKVPSYQALRGSVMPSYQASNIIILHSPLLGELMAAKRDVVSQRIPLDISIQKNRFFGKYETIEVPFIPAIGRFDDVIPSEWAERYIRYKDSIPKEVVGSAIAHTEVEPGDKVDLVQSIKMIKEIK